MIDTSLITITEALRNGRTISKGAVVTLPIVGKAFIYGFVATLHNIYGSIMDMPPLGKTTVLSNRVLSYFHQEVHNFPVFNSIRKSDSERLELRNLHIPKYLHFLDKQQHYAYIQFLRYNELRPAIERIEGVVVEDNKAYYLPQDKEFYFESESELKAISKGCAVVTRRVSGDSDSLVYEIFNPGEVLIEQ